MNVLKLNLIVVALVLALTAGFVFGLLLPGLEHLEQRRNVLAEDAVKVRRKQQMVGNVSDLYASILKLDDEMRDFRKRLPVERRFGEFVNGVCENLMSCGIDDYFPQQKRAKHLDKARLPDALKLAEGTTILPVSLSFESSFARLFDFLKRMESMARLSRVQSMRLVNNEKQPGRLNVEMTLHTYHHPG